MAAEGASLGAIGNGELPSCTLSVQLSMAGLHCRKISED